MTALDKARELILRCGYPRAIGRARNLHSWTNDWVTENFWEEVIDCLILLDKAGMVNKIK